MDLKHAVPLLSATLCVAAVPALASEPSSGKVSKDSPSVKWSGSVIGPVFTFGTIFSPDGTTCQPPSCDKFALDVADTADMTVNATSDGSSITTLMVEKPDGSTVMADGIDPDGSPNNTTTLKIKKAPVGAYTVMVGVDTATTADYTGDATLAIGAPLAPAPTTGTPPATPPPGASPPSSAPAPQPSATLTLKVSKLSARKLAKSKKLAATVSTSKPVTGVVAKLMSGKKVVATGKLAKLSGTAKVTLKIKRKLKPGKYTLLVQAKDGATGVGASLPVKIAR